MMNCELVKNGSRDKKGTATFNVFKDAEGHTHIQVKCMGYQSLSNHGAEEACMHCPKYKGETAE